MRAAVGFLCVRVQETAVDLQFQNSDTATLFAFAPPYVPHILPASVYLSALPFFFSTQVAYGLFGLCEPAATQDFSSAAVRAVGPEPDGPVNQNNEQGATDGSALEPQTGVLHFKSVGRAGDSCTPVGFTIFNIVHLLSRHYFLSCVFVEADD